MKMALAVACVVAVLLMSGCANPYFKNAAPGRGLIVPEGEVLVFGRVSVTENGKSVGSSLKGWPVVFNLSTKEYVNVTVKEDGYFWWLLPGGSYELSDLHYRRDYIQVKVRLDVPEDSAGAVYVGTLRVDTAPGGWIGIEKRQTNAVTIADDFEEAMGALEKRNPGFSVAAGKGLMVHDVTLPDDPRSKANEAVRRDRNDFLFYMAALFVAVLTAP
ncbi:MAG: hypothetical protein OEV59_10175 [Deltaproteobacteria bacterium]|nr:hypothetical protein [Deltaproteobacteria bacterium]